MLIFSGKINTSLKFPSDKVYMRILLLPENKISSNHLIINDLKTLHTFKLKFL